jgi:hypothetical protein
MSRAIVHRLRRLEGRRGKETVNPRRLRLAALGAPEGLTPEEEEEWLRPMTEEEWVAAYCTPKASEAGA